MCEFERHAAPIHILIKLILKRHLQNNISTCTQIERGEGGLHLSIMLGVCGCRVGVGVGVRYWVCGAILGISGSATSDGRADLLCENITSTNLRCFLHRSKFGHNPLRLAKVDLIESHSHLRLLLLDHSSNVDEMRRHFGHCRILLHLSSERSAQIEDSTARLARLQPQHHSRRQFVMRLTRPFGDFNDVYRIPAALHILCPISILLEENDAGETVSFQFPEVHRGDTTVKVHVSVCLECCIRLNLECAKSLRGKSSVLEGGIVLIRPWRTVAVSVSVVVTHEILLARLLVLCGLERLVNRRQKILTERGSQI
ncbi:hypothetical protein PFISCL1PPCAC_6492, partial [Pristionchus fissidentatus]